MGCLNTIVGCGLMLLAAACSSDTQSDASPVDASLDSNGDGANPQCSTDDATPGCAGDAACCSSDEYYYKDSLCGPLQEGGISCTDFGDRACHKKCASDADCPDSCMPYCRRLGLFAGGDYNCNSTVMICREIDKDDCR
jgi:hypothetical protein